MAFVGGMTPPGRDTGKDRVRQPRSPRAQVKMLEPTIPTDGSAEETAVVS